MCYSSSCTTLPSPLDPIKSRMETFWYWLIQIHLENGERQLRKISNSGMKDIQHSNTILIKDNRSDRLTVGKSRDDFWRHPVRSSNQRLTFRQLGRHLRTEAKVRQLYLNMSQHCSLHFTIPPHVSNKLCHQFNLP